MSKICDVAETILPPIASFGCARILFRVFIQLLHNDGLSSRYTVLTTLRLAALRCCITTVLSPRYTVPATLRLATSRESFPGVA
jgi:hypothetical protein